MYMDGKAIEGKILSTFADVAQAAGYSPLHGRIIGILLVEGKALSLQDIARKTGYSSSMVSLSLDLLELLGVIKRVKKTGDRKLYIRLSGDLLETLKSAFTMKLEKSIGQTLEEFGKNKEELEGLKGPEKKRLLNTLNTLEGEVKRLERYINLLSKIKLP